MELPEFNGLQHMGDFGEAAERFPEMLSGAPLFRSLAADSGILARHMHVFVAPEGSLILREGEPGNAMLLIIEGMVQVVRGDPQTGITLGILDRGKTLGEMSLLDQKPRSATCIALHDCVLAVLSQPALEKLIDQYPRMGAAILREIARMLSHRLRRTNEKVDDDWTQFVDV